MKRFYMLILSIVLLSSLSVAQKKRLLVIPGNDVIELKKGQSAGTVAARHVTGMSAASAACVNPVTFGFDPGHYPVTGGHVSGHKDIFAEWLVVPADGNIDSVFLNIGDGINHNSGDTTGELYFRLFKSAVYNGHGPWPGSTDYPPPGTPDPGTSLIPRCWGFYDNTNDLDGNTYNVGTACNGQPCGGVAAFKEDATATGRFGSYEDSTGWVATNQLQYPSSPKSFAPTESLMWGGGGFPMSIRNNAQAGIDLHPLTPGNKGPKVWAGLPIFLTFRVPKHAWPEPSDVFADSDLTNINRSDEDPLPDGSYITHTWKFYEHNSTCSPNATNNLPGWICRGVWNNMFWYTMSVNSNIAPTIDITSNPRTTFNNDTRDILINIEDCNFANPSQSGVATAKIWYQYDGLGSYTSVNLSHLGGTSYKGQLPPAPPTNVRPYYRTVRYYVTSSDSQGFGDTTSISQYRVLNFGNEWYVADTTATFDPTDIKTTGTSLDTSAFFQAPGASTSKWDDGTAGPFDIGGPFVYFGDTMHYAWVGVNGSIALSKTATDTIDVNAAGFFSSYTLPGVQRLGRADTINASGLPRNFIAAMWADLLLADSTVADGFRYYGSILHYDDVVNNRFVVQFDSIGQFGTADPHSDMKFRIVLNRNDGTIEFQYDQVEGYGLDTTCLSGLMGDSLDGTNPGWLFITRTYGSDRGPTSTKPRNSFKITLSNAQAFATIAGWNMVSVPMTADDYAKSAVFPNAVSNAFKYAGGYQTADPLENGLGYWLKFPVVQNVIFNSANGLSSQSVSLAAKWNMMGSIGKSVPVSVVKDITHDPGGIIVGNIFGYNAGGYFTASAIEPGKGYWVKASGAGTITLSPAAAAAQKAPTPGAELNEMSSIVISDASKHEQTLYIGSEGQLKTASSFYELPPPPPAGTFDARFASQRMVETYPATRVDGQKYEYPITINASAYPVTVRWYVKGDNVFTLSDAIGGRVLNNAVLANNGSLRITNAGVKSLVLKFATGQVAVPKVFALHQNYPNPFNPTTRFNVDIPKTTEVEIAVYDILGQKITTLLSGVQSAGYLTVEWNGVNQHSLTVPSGMYFIRMTSDDFSAVRKVMLLK